jgi:hypothetical protein
MFVVFGGMIALAGCGSTILSKVCPVSGCSGPVSIGFPVPYAGDTGLTIIL